MPGTYIDMAEVVLGEYDAVIRSNRTPGWNTLQLVSECEDGLYGAWGEVMDCASEKTWWPDVDEAWAALYAAYSGWRIALRAQVAAEAAHQAWRTQT